MKCALNPKSNRTPILGLDLYGYRNKSGTNTNFRIEYQLLNSLLLRALCALASVHSVLNVFALLATHRFLQYHLRTHAPRSKNYDSL